MSDIEWRPVVGFEGYKVSNQGDIMSTRRGKPKLLAKCPNSDGYYLVNLYDGSGLKGRRPRMIHRCVAEAFIPNPENKEAINHKDLNKTNNKPENLEWCTQFENTQHAQRAGVFKNRPHSFRPRHRHKGRFVKAPQYKINGEWVDVPVTKENE